MAKSKKDQLDQKNVKETVAQVVKSTREMKWKLPKDCDTLKKKRAFRQANRTKLRKMESELLKSPSRKLKREYKALRKEVLLVP